MATSARISASPAESRRTGATGMWRVVAAVPAMAASLLLLVVFLGWLGRWEALALLGWLASGTVVLTPVGERITVRLTCGFRRPSTSQAAALAPLWAAALRLTGTTAGDVDLYVQRCRQLNAYAVGGRSVAVTTRVFEESLAHRLAGDQLVAVLVHELGHHATRATRFALVTVWLAAPWRLATRLFFAATHAVAGRQPRPLLVVAVCAGVVVAVVQAVGHGSWTVAGCLAGNAVLALICPLADAALARRAEFAADRFAADHGLAAPLAAALRTLSDDHKASSGWTRRIVALHPATDRRIDALALP